MPWPGEGLLEAVTVAVPEPGGEADALVVVHGEGDCKDDDEGEGLGDAE